MYAHRMESNQWVAIEASAFGTTFIQELAIPIQGRWRSLLTIKDGKDAAAADQGIGSNNERQ